MIQSIGTALSIWIGLVLLGWLATASFAAWLAGERGRPIGRWFLLGLLTGPLAVVVVGLSPRIVGQRFKACLECAEPVERRATTCPWCSADLIDVEEAEAEFQRLRAEGDEPT